MAELEKQFPDQGLEFALIRGQKGIFDVSLDGRRVYSKHAEGGFPRYGEIPKRLLKML